jgi:CBS domain-containing membrane protein
MSPDTEKESEALFQIDISDDDIYEAMKDIPGYLDVTPGDLKELYAHAYRHAFERIACSVRASDLMTRKVHAVNKETPLKDVAELMAKNEISGVPVVDANRQVVGIISEKDFCSHMGDRRAESLMQVIADCAKDRGCPAMTIREQKAEDIMTTPAITLREDTVLMEITAVLQEKNINRIPVLDPKGCLVGIVSRADIIRASFEKTR